ncbi:hypothetical protein ACRAWF_36095 [Streptomyces sp. L7]
MEFNSALGPYKGGLRFHRSGRPRHREVPRLRADLQERPDRPRASAAARAAATSTREGRSDAEVMRFCQSFMTELHRHIGRAHGRAGRRHRGGRPRDRLPVRAVPAYHQPVEAGVLTGKGVEPGAARPAVWRPPATATSCSPPEMLQPRGGTCPASRCWSPVPGNVAIYSGGEAQANSGRGS